MYRVVFGVRYTKWLVAVMFGFFIFHPAVPAFAAEVEVASSGSASEKELSTERSEEQSEVETTDSAEQEAEVDQEMFVSEGASESDEDAAINIDVPEASISEVPADSPDEAIIDDTNQPTPVNDQVTDTDDESSDSTQDEDTATTTIESGIDEATTTESVATTTADVPENATEDEQGDVIAEDDTEEVLAETEDVIEDLASTSQEALATTTVTEIYQSNEDNPLHFNPQDCVSVGDGSYYCERQTEPLPSYEEDEVFAALDADGDNEIYIRLRGEVTQLTHNLVDDMAPSLDSVGNYVAWHRLIDDRYQVVLYDLKKSEESQITNSATNNMQPHVFDGKLVWQTWDGHDWEVVYFDGDDTTAITNNEQPDLSPRLNDNYIIWNIVHENNEKGIAVYNLVSGQVELIDDTDDVTVKNPRFILMYEAEYENGDVVTRGFDVETGNVIPLNTSPHEQPERIPEPDQTGETRALIATKTNARESEEMGDLEVVEKPSATSTDSVLTNDDVVVTASSTAPAIATSTPATATSTDLVVPAFDTSPAEAVIDVIATTTTPTEHIPDLIIPPTTATNTAEVR